ncbi:MAG: aminotransferase class I/II-fold pyridoxal phosphate-dependent enzyme [Coprobacter sp.]|nr:aminotransferase class I/II-fold pyridoxal phosphate-dependent enzyme [Coprobacter sp.]
MQNSLNPFDIVPANRVNSVSEYYFSKKLREIAELNAQGKQIISLGIGSPDQPPHPQTIETLCHDSRLPNAHGYQPYVGIPELRKAFADWYQKWFGVTLDAQKEIQPLIGSKEGILHISLAFLNPGDAVLVPNPGYPTYSSVSRLAEARLIEYKLSPENGWMPDFDDLEQQDLSGVKLMWVNYPNMPTGTPATPDLFRRLVDFGKRHRIIIVNDNPYSFILNDKQLSILSVPGAKEICIEMNSMSKSHNMPGWRIGMLASNARFVEWILRVKSNIDSGMFRPLQTAAVTALQTAEAWHREMNIDLYRRRRNIAEAIALELGCTFDAAQVGMFLWARIPDSEKDAVALADKVLYDARVFITPGIIFGSQGERYIRISLCAGEDTLQEALNRIRKDITHSL